MSNESKAKLSEQSQRFIDAAREAGCSEDETKIRENMKQIAARKINFDLKQKDPLKSGSGD